MDKIKNLLTQLTTGKNKKFFYIGLGIILILIIFLAVNKQSSLKNGTTTTTDETTGGDYIGIQADDGTRYYSFNTNEIYYTDADYGYISFTINAQLFFRETQEKSYYTSNPYDKKEISKQIIVYIEDAIYKIINENEDLKYNHLRDVITNERITEIIKDQVASLGFEFVKIDIYTFALTKESIALIKDIEVSKRELLLPEESTDENVESEIIDEEMPITEEVETEDNEEINSSTPEENVDVTETLNE